LTAAAIRRKQFLFALAKTKGVLPRMPKDAKEVLCHLIAGAEKLYGPRVQYDIGEVLICPDKKYAQTIVNTLNNTITVDITVFRGHKDVQTIYQLAHEAVHCLCPVSRVDTLYLEEGLAISHALNEARKLNRNYAATQRALLQSPWREAFISFQKWPLDLTKIRNLRRQQPFLDLVTPEQIKTFLNASDELANELCQRLPHGRG
jgi:hypothetical protein